MALPFTVLRVGRQRHTGIPDARRYALWLSVAGRGVHAASRSAEHRRLEGSDARPDANAESGIAGRRATPTGVGSADKTTLHYASGAWCGWGRDWDWVCVTKMMACESGES
jgi:hypothetical protein